jgi:hypothetical protein
MAEFSKQYCELHMPEFLPGDFDICEIANGMDPNYYVSHICEGFGFVAIAKNDKGDILLAIPHGYSDDVTWERYEDVIK